MRRKRTDKMRIILSAGGCGILSGWNMTEGLMTLQLLLKLKNCGLVIAGNSFSVFRIYCCQELYEKIRDRSKKSRDMLILQETGEGIKVIRRRFRRKRLVQMKEFIVAAGSGGLFFIIDQKPEKLEMLSVMQADEIFANKKEDPDEKSEVSN